MVIINRYSKNTKYLSIDIVKLYSYNHYLLIKRCDSDLHSELSVAAKCRIKKGKHYFLYSRF